MTTQSDREKAERYALEEYGTGFANLAITDYLAGAQAKAIEKDLEWQAKVQGLVELIGPAIAAFRGSGNGAQAICAVENLEQALSQFTSGQPAKAVMVPMDLWCELRDHLIAQDAGSAFEVTQLVDPSAAMGIGKDGGK